MKDQPASKKLEAFRDCYGAFQERAAEVIGVSGQSVESHKGFAAHRNLPYILLSDADGSVRKLYGVASTLGVPGRVTFVIDKEGIVVHIFASQLQFTRHAKEGLSALKNI